MELYTGYGEIDLKMLLVQTSIFFDTDERPSTDPRISSQPEVLLELRTWKSSVCVFSVLLFIVLVCDIMRNFTQVYTV